MSFVPRNYNNLLLIFTIKKGNIVNTVNRWPRSFSTAEVLDFVMDDFVDTFQHGSDDEEDEDSCDDDPQDSGDYDISSR